MIHITKFNQFWGLGMDNVIGIMIGGEAGQGLVTVGELLSKGLMRSGFHVLTSQSYMSRVRGGHNTFTVQVSATEINSLSESIDILVALDAATIKLHRKALAKNALTLVDEEIAGNNSKAIKIPYGKLASTQQVNVIALGILGYILGLDQELLAAVVDEHFAAKQAESKLDNRKALKAAFTWAARLAQSSLRQLTAPKTRKKRIMLNGNQAIALGAISAGLKFCAFYPMTPVTSIPQTLAKYADKMGMVVEQVEDEIAAINMALGASFTGVLSMVGTSG